MPDRQELAFDDLPAVLPSYLRALVRRGSGLSAGETIPRIVARVDALEVRAENLARYRKVCGFAHSDVLPLTYPHVLAFPLQLALLTHRRFPLRLPGLIHARNRISQHRAIRVDEPLEVNVSVDGHRNARKGLEFDLETRVNDRDGATLWEETSVMLSPIRNRSRRSSKEHPAEDMFVPDEEAIWQVPADIGRRYAAVAGDYNPIHLSSWSARLFGFSRAIATGMWMKARAAAALQPHVISDAYSLSVAFKKPVSLPSRLSFKRADVDGGIDFVLVGRSGEINHLTGEMRYLCRTPATRSTSSSGVSMLR